MKTIRVVAAIIIDEGKIFATQRGYGEFKGGWEFPGGKIEPNETPEAAIVREIKEELDTEVQVIELLDTVEYDYPKFHLSMDCFVCQVRSGDLVLKEHKATIGISFLSRNKNPAYPSTIGSTFGVLRLAMILRKHAATASVIGT